MKKIDWYPTSVFIMRRYLFNKLLPKSIRGEFLEVGIGEGGGLLMQLDKRGFSGIGIDYSREAIRKAKKRLAGKFFPKIRIKKQDIWKVKRKFGLLIAMEILEHCQEDQKLLKHFLGLLNNGGFLIFSVPAKMKKWGPGDEIVGHIRRYQKKDLVLKLKKAGFKEMVVLSYGFPLLNFSSSLRNFWLEIRPHKERIIRKTKKERTKESGGRFLKTPLSLLFSDFLIWPFNVFQTLFLNLDLGIGYIIKAKKC